MAVITDGVTSQGQTIFWKIVMNDFRCLYEMILRGSLSEENITIFSLAECSFNLRQKVNISSLHFLT